MRCGTVCGIHQIWGRVCVERIVVSGMKYDGAMFGCCLGGEGKVAVVD